MGAAINTGQNFVEIDATLTDLKACNISTEPFPGLTDMQAQFMALNTISKDCKILRMFLKIGFNMWLS